MSIQPWKEVDPSWSDAELMQWLKQTNTVARFQNDYRQSAIDMLIRRDWEPQMARTYGILSALGAALAKTLRERNRLAAPCVHALYHCLYQRSKLQAAAEVPMLYRHLRNSSGGRQSLIDVDPAWASLEVPDATGFCGLCSSGLTVADCDPANFSTAGYSRRYASKEGVEYILEDSDVVGFLSRHEDDRGAHSAVLTYSDHTGAFPPNTLFRLREVREPGTWQAPGGVYPQQRLLVVSATYLIPDVASADSGGGSKLCAPPVTLSFGNRDAYVSGIDGLIARPFLTMEQECTREVTWTDWAGVTYSLAAEWEYINGPAKPKDGCTPGITRDVDNAGRTPADFQRLANEMIRARRAAGIGTAMPESHAFLTLDDVLAVRLFSGPAYQLINTFLRQVSALQGAFREQLAQHPHATFTATVRQLCCAIRKLAAVTPPNEAQALLYRGVRGELPPAFWQSADSMGLVVAVDMAFMSTSKNMTTPIGYMQPGRNVLWRLHAEPDSDAAFHHGADISLLSQFAAEQEILYPPMTMLQVLAREVETEEQDGAIRPVERSKSRSRFASGARFRSVDASRFMQVCKDGEREYTIVDVLPSFL